MADKISWEEILSAVSCNICGSEYNCLEDTYPVFLDCYHTFCYTCADSLYAKNFDCPKCAQPVTRNSRFLAPNFAIIYAPEVLDDLKSFTLEHLNLIKDLVQSLEIKAARFKSRNTKNEITGILNEIKQRYRDVENAVAEESEREPELIKLGNISEFRSYLENIIIKLQNNKKVFVTTSGDHAKYGRVSFWKNTVLFHSLCLPAIPPNSYVVEINDIYVRPNRDCNIAFLNLSYNRNGETEIMMMDVPATDSGESFIFNCLGLQYWYKNLYYTRGRTTEEFEEVVKIVRPSSIGFVSTGTPNIGRDEFIVHHDERFIQTDESGNFKIIRTYNSVDNIYYIAIETLPITFRKAFDYSDPTMLKIVDCGLAIKYSFQ